MQFFIDTADIEAIKPLMEKNLIDGVTTNPSLMAKKGGNLLEVIAEIAQLVSGPISAEVTKEDYEGMLQQAKTLVTIAPNICIKLPITFDGLRACRTLVDQGYKTNLTLCFSATQALLAAKAGATYVSPFIGRLDDMGINGMELIAEIRTIFDQYNFSTRILAASIRTVNHVKEAALLGADVATIPPALLEKLIEHPLTEKGLELFRQDSQKGEQISF